MAEQYLIQDSSLTRIGDAIRGVLNTTITYTPAEMAEAIGNQMAASESLKNYTV